MDNLGIIKKNDPNSKYFELSYPVSKIAEQSRAFINLETAIMKK